MIRTLREVMHTVAHTWEAAAVNRGLSGAMTELFELNLALCTNVAEAATARISLQAIATESPGRRD